MTKENRIADSDSDRQAFVGRRSFLAATVAAAAAAATTTAAGREYGKDAEPVRYPDPDIVVLDDRFKKYKLGNTPIQRLHTGMLWAEGPAWNGVGRYLLWSDIPNDVQMRWLEEDGHVSVFRNPAGNSNGNTFDWEGRQIACEHGNRRVVRYEYDGKTTVLADRWDRKRLNAPNDAVVHPEDGSIWFTDPGYGSLMNYEGNKGELEIKEAIYRIDAQTLKLEKLTDEIYKPNGLCFSPDYKQLYVAETGTSHYEESPRNIKTWDIVDGKKLAKGREFVSMELDGKAGFADGIRADVDGNIWASAGWVGEGYDGVHVFSPDGTRIGQILLPEICSNVCFGGKKRNRLFMTGSQSLYAVYVETRGAQHLMSAAYHVRLSKDYLVFSAGHFITYGGNICERLHGHNYRVAAEVDGPLDENHYVVDFIALRDALRELVAELDHHMLLPTLHPTIKVSADAKEVLVTFEDRRWIFPRGDCILLPVENTTTELLARYLGLKLLDLLQARCGWRPARLRMEVDECEGQLAVCELSGE